MLGRCVVNSLVMLLWVLWIVGIMICDGFLFVSCMMNLFMLDLM